MKAENPAARQTATCGISEDARRRIARQMAEVHPRTAVSFQGRRQEAVR